MCVAWAQGWVCAVAWLMVSVPAVSGRIPNSLVSRFASVWIILKSLTPASFPSLPHTETHMTNTLSNDYETEKQWSGRKRGRPGGMSRLEAARWPNPWIYSRRGPLSDEAFRRLPRLQRRHWKRHRKRHWLRPSRVFLSRGTYAALFHFITSCHPSCFDF